MGTEDHFPVDVCFQFGIGIEVQRFFGVFTKEAQFLQGALEVNAGETNPVDTAAGLGECRQFALDRTDVLAGTVEVTVGDNRTGCIKTLVVDIPIIEQGKVVVPFDAFAKVLRHGHSISQLTEILLLLEINQCFLLVVERLKLGTDSGVGTVSIYLSHFSPHFIR